MLPTGRLLSGCLGPQSSAVQWCSLESCWCSSSWCLKVSSLCTVLGTRKVLSLCEILHFLCVNTFCRHAGIGAGVCPWRKDGCLLFFWSHLSVFHWAHPHCGQEHGPRRHYYSVTHRHHHLSIHSLSRQVFFVCFLLVAPSHRICFTCYLTYKQFTSPSQIKDFSHNYGDDYFIIIVVVVVIVFLLLLFYHFYFNALHIAAFRFMWCSSKSHAAIFLSATNYLTTPHHYYHHCCCCHCNYYE